MGEREQEPVAPDNPFLVMQKGMSDESSALDAWRDMRDAWSEKMFFAIYGSPHCKPRWESSPQPAGQGSWRPKALCTDWSAPASPN
jgi:hypothetical protein